MKKNMMFLVALAAGLFFSAAQGNGDDVNPADYATAVIAAAKDEKATAESIKKASDEALKGKKDLNNELRATIINTIFKNKSFPDKNTEILRRNCLPPFTEKDVDVSKLDDETKKVIGKYYNTTWNKIKDNKLWIGGGVGLVTIAAVVGVVVARNYGYLGGAKKDASTPAASQVVEVPVIS